MSYAQRNTPALAELCSFFIDDLYGELASRVFSVVARFGRQRISDILPRSTLNRRQANAAMVILVQQHLVSHSPLDPTDPDKPVYYEVDWQQAYALVRCGRVAKLVEDRYGKNYANIISNLWSLGHARISELRDAYFPSPESDSDSDDESDSGVVNGIGLKRKRNGYTVNNTTSAPAETPNGVHSPKILTNGVSASNGIHASNDTLAANGTSAPQTNGFANHSDDSIESVEQLYEIIHELMKNGWVMQAHEDQYLSAGDFHEKARQEAMDNHSSGVEPTGIKEKTAVALGTLHAKRRLRNAWLEPPQTLGLSRNGPVRKRVKLDGDTTTNDLVIRINPEKIAVAMRTEQLIGLVEQRIGPITARIYRIMLESLESNIPRCFDEWWSPPFRDKDGKEISEPAKPSEEDMRIFIDHLARKTHDLDICEGLDPSVVSHLTGRSLVTDPDAKRIKAYLDTPIDPQKLDAHQRRNLVEKHVELLAQDPFHFATWVGRGTYRIDFDVIAKAHIQHELENTILGRTSLGPLGVKVVRGYQRRGKLDERQICDTLMCPVTDIRGTINELTLQGFLQTQELPKVDRRETRHSFHLVWYDRQRAREKILHDTYKGMVRIMQRLKYERERVADLLAKAERTDVVGNEAKYLTPQELDALKKWKEIQEKLLLQLCREDELVAILRDFIGPLVSA